ncbi:MAG: peptidase T [Ferruginibacter sp.]|nr:peptidase T [Ferruginibacter sp.]
MISIDTKEVAERFMRYVQVDTQSDPTSNAAPTTEKQKNLSIILTGELKQMGLQDVQMDTNGYVYATLPSNSKKNTPVIAFCSHVDTAPDCSGTNVKPILHTGYDGKDIILPDDNTLKLSMNDFPYLKKHIGKDIITASGLTLLGADDKSGVAAIMQGVKFLIDHPEISHGEVRIIFTPDEEVGKGTDHIDMKKVNAHAGYTFDGGEAGSLEDETFSADAATITFNGVIVHPGYAKNRLINALKIAGGFLDSLPKNEWSPETTEKREGFVHPVAFNGIAEKAVVQFIVRDFETAKLTSHHARLKSLAEAAIAPYPGTSVTYEISEQYRNMKDVLVKHPEIVNYAAKAIKCAGLEVVSDSIRGGTDGSRLSYMGLPCPNIFTGMQNIHSKLEWIGTSDMAKAAEVMIHLCTIWEEESK